MDENQKQQIQLPPNDLAEMDYVSHRWDARVPPSVTPEDVLVPAFWSHHAVKIKPMDEIRVRAEDGTWVGYYIVLDSSRTWARCVCLSMHSLTTADVSATQASSGEVAAFIAQHKVVHRGSLKWSVVRESDKAVLIEGQAQKEDAVAWLDTHARSYIGAPKAQPVAA